MSISPPPVYCLPISVYLYSPVCKSAQSLILGDIRDNTKHTYTSTQIAYMTFCDTYGLSPIPANEQTLLNYIAHCYQKHLKATTIHVYITAIHNLHILHSAQPPPAQASRVKLALKAIYESGPGPNGKKIPYYIHIIVVHVSISFNKSWSHSMVCHHDLSLVWWFEKWGIYNNKCLWATCTAYSVRQSSFSVIYLFYCYTLQKHMHMLTRYPLAVLDLLTRKFSHWVYVKGKPIQHTLGIYKHIKFYLLNDFQIHNTILSYWASWLVHSHVGYILPNQLYTCLLLL